MTPDAFDNHRSFLMGIAYRMLGSSSEAEDAVQDTWLRWHGNSAEVRNPRAWLGATITRICIDRLRSARAKREEYVGPWLPEPVVTEDPIDVDSLSLGLLVLLEQLTPVERAVFILHEAFDYSHQEIADVVRRSEAACRQSLSRARKHLAGGAPRNKVDAGEHERILRVFAAALFLGDVTGLRNVLAEDAQLIVDSGGKVRGAARRPITGAEQIARFFAGLVRNVSIVPAVSVVSINGLPSLVGRIDGKPYFVMSIEADGSEVTRVRNMINPDKLHLLRVD